MVLHAAVNFPTKGIYDFVLPAAMVAALILFRPWWLSLVKNFGQQIADKGWKREALAGALLASVLAVGFEAWSNVFVPLGFLSLVAALTIEFRERQLERSPARNAS